MAFPSREELEAQRASSWTGLPALGSFTYLPAFPNPFNCIVQVVQVFKGFSGIIGLSFPSRLRGSGGFSPLFP